MPVSDSPRMALASSFASILMACAIMGGCAGEPAGQQPSASADGVAATQGAAGASGTASEADSGEHGLIVREFSAKTTKGDAFLPEQLQACDVTVLNIWSTTCPPCLAEMPSLGAFAATLPPNVQVITWCLNGSGREDDVDKFMAKNGCADVTTLVSGSDDLMDLYRTIQYTPTVVFIDATGRIIGDYLIGSPTDLAAAYTAGINAALAAQGKDPLE